MRFLRLLVCGLLFAVCGGASWGAGTPSIWLSGANTDLSTVTTYISPCGGTATATETRRGIVIPCAGTVDYMRVKITTASGAGGRMRHFTCRKGRTTDQTLKVDIDNTTSGSDTTHSFTVAAADVVTIRYDGDASTANSGPWSIALRFTPTGNQQSIVALPLASAVASNATSYMGAMYYGGVGGATNVSVECPFPASGTLDSLYIQVETAPGGSETDTVTLMKNNATSALTKQLMGSTTADHDTTNSVSVTAGDTISFQVVLSASAATTRIAISMRFQPTTDGQCVCLMPADNVTIGSGATTYFLMTAGSYNTTESNCQVGLIACDVKNLYTKITGIAAGQNAVSTIRKGASPTGSPTTTATNSNPNQSDTTNTLTFADDNLLSLQVVTSASSGTVTASHGFVLYVAPAAGGTVKARRGADHPKAGTRGAIHWDLREFNKRFGGALCAL